MIDPYMNFESTVLPNGLTIYVSHLPGCAWESVGFLIHSGAEQDPIGREGMAHFAEHLVSVNTTKTREEIKSFFDSCGGSINLGVTSFDKTEYKFFAPSNETLLRQALTIMGSMLITCKIKYKVEHEREIVIQEFNRIYPDKNDAAMYKDFKKQKALYSGFWLERFVKVLGTPDTILKITQDDLQSFYDTHYTPPNMSIVCVGGMTLHQITAMLSESAFAEPKKGSRAPCPIPLEDTGFPTATRLTQKPLTAIKNHFAKTGSYRSYAKVPYSKNFGTTQIIITMLHRVLNEEIREMRRWTYHISAGYYDFRHFFEVEIDCKAFSKKASPEIEEVIESCITGLRTRHDLFHDVQELLIAHNALRDMSGVQVMSGVLNSLAKCHRIRTLTEMNVDLSKVTMSDIAEAVKWLTPDRRYTILT